MRIIAGSAGGLSLRTPKGEITRPATDRVRESVFSMLGGLVEGATVLDLFAGAGSLGIEALSRGGESALFVESRRVSARIIEENLERAGLESRGWVLVRTVENFLRVRAGGGHSRHNLIFADPPYATGEETTDYIAYLLESRVLPELLAANGILILEVPRRYSRHLPEGWHLADARTYGTNEIWFLQRA